MRRCLMFVPCLTLFGCQSATEARVRLHTDVEHVANLRMAMWAGVDTGANGAPAVSTEGPWSRDGIIGSIHLVPRDDNRESELSIRAVLSLDGQDPATCAPGNPRCIVSTRRLRYLKHKRLTVPVGLYRRCLGVSCASDATCNAQGACVPDALDVEACAADDGCVLPGDPPTPPGVIVAPSDAGADAPSAPIPLAPVPRPVFLDIDPRRGLVNGVMDLGDPEPLTRGGTLVARELRWVGAPGAAPVRVPVAQRSYAFLGDYRAPSGADLLEVRNVVTDALGREVVSEPATLRGDNYVRRLDIAAGTGADSVAQTVPFLANGKLLVLTRAPDNRVSLRTCTAAGTQCTGKSLPTDLQLGRIFADVDPLDLSKGLLLTGTDPRTGRLTALRCSLDATTCDAIAIPKAEPIFANRIIGRIDPITHDAVLVYGSDGAAQIQEFSFLRCPSSGAACTTHAPVLPAPDAETATIDDVVIAPATGIIKIVGRAFLSEAISIYRATCSAQSCSTSLDDAPFTEASSEGAYATTLYDIDFNEVVSLTPATGLLTARRCSGAGGKLSCAQFGAIAHSDLQAVSASFVGPPGGLVRRPVALLLSNVGTWRLLRCADTGCVDVNLDGALGSGQTGEGGLVSTGTAAAPEMRIVAPNTDLGGAPSHVRTDANLKALSVSTIGGINNFAGSVRADNGGESRLGIAYDATGRLVVTATNPTLGDRVSAFRCDTEGAQCSHLPVESVESAGRSNGGGFGVLPLFDAKSSRFVFLTSDRRSGTGTSRSGRPSAFFCDTNLASCSFLDVVLGRQPLATWSPPQGAIADLGVDKGVRLLAAARDSTGAVRVATCEVGGGDCGLDARSWGSGTVASVAGNGAIVVQRDDLRVEQCNFATATCDPLGTAPRDAIAATLRYAPSAQGLATMAVSRSQSDLRRLSVVIGQLPGASVVGRVSFLGGNVVVKGSLVVDQPRNTIYALTGTQTLAQLLRCKVGSGLCDVLYEGPGLLRAEPSLSLRPDGKRLFVAIGDDANNGRPSLLVLDL